SSFGAIDKAVGKEGWKIVGLLRLSPLFPFSLLNYGLGLTSVKWLPYAVATFFGMLPGTFLYVYIGYAVAQGLRAEGEKSILDYAFLAAGLIATLVVTIFITKIAKKALAERTQEDTA
ncbi:MAG: VTT domain-containing protein, partial [Verrucomicrobiota bacterium]